MSSRKRNDPFDLVASDEDSDQDKGYDSAADEEKKSKGALRAAKRRRVATHTDNLHGLDSEESDADAGLDSEVEETKGKGKSKSRKKGVNRGGESEDEEEEEEEGVSDAEAVAGAAATLTKEKKGKKDTKDKKKKKEKKKGVVYLSSVPPMLKPFALKNIIETRGFAPITRVFLTPETKRKHSANKRRKTYADGWLEFESKKTAKICAATLNAQPIGGKKGGFYHDDLLNMKYLHGFSWNDLQEQISRERSEREARQRAEDSRARKEDKVFLEGVEKGKVLDGMRRKNEEKEARRLAAEKKGAERAVADAAALGKVRRVFRQNEVRLGRDKSTQEIQDLGDDTKRVLGKIF
ncbi:RNA-binding ATPase activator ESF2 [Aspergillus homomorphus CBS 101889]|uniref:18S rRNA factor 2 n=1 Tax=Aspergillus homomorphus (strain CBS 101889) TaxID=1450537 RepID=A0A395I9M7_ASPHC|nr:hypothetical protein BO97DRAFT_403889 [Aspergillus homomorphus CBS 101889]RAL14844.1 hypothetical protein BO97DRAFT_403889 [Aspergillus homomorphus CBS 101889]